MRRNYEIYLMQHVSGSVEDDWETVGYISEYDHYRDYSRIAKELSRHYGDINVSGCPVRFTKREVDDDGFYRHGLDEGLAMVKITCWVETDDSTYQPVYYEYYKDGKVLYKVNFDFK
ncbi:MAG: hypothetical protein J6Y37_10925 [Paludibacteraceae bacterium]|nr:hypothetical protein [Paludibacteraceae bacterium]